ncbi:TPA: hypothetical protein QDC37_005866 [Burkholderia aenigmatica]|uniref:hypothetical protein n=1 Tax=Burkholderia sp. AU45251 TaxID=3059204 RepID=UPI00264E5DE8|nr:hypothetical protein [Burkholderia sp. AU45251]HDR9486919.1 hypothetical protein [Burkholderia aenigmatica]MDN7518861.1 hypothetical protein [Burkholderia sp. AU45251]HDR9698505.1 hypothetical protein [Burkholderia aenigmatica]HDR9706706.1 hypothetical protein [Burkholderia aenigmatica]HDR9730061.1 hypothetical protein [Burkholderia aenigmatica]
MHPETVSRRICMQRDATVTGRATLRCDCLTVHRSGAARQVLQTMPPRIVPPQRQTIQTVGNDTRRSISIDCAHDAAHPCAGSRLK